MSEYVILADSCMDLSPEQRKQFNIEKPVPGSVVYPDGTDHLSDIDWEEISFEEFYRRLDKKENFKTGLPNQFLIGETFEEFFHSMEKKAVYKSSMQNPVQVAERVEE